MKPSWLDDPALCQILDALEAAGGRGCVRAVGGAVRNTLMDLPVADVDLATTLRPEAVMDALEAAALKAVPTGLDHGTVTAVSGGRGFEITALRRDVATDGRRAVVAFTDDWSEDARRRDFHLNALYMSRDGTVHDPTGQGVDDARAGRIVFVGNAGERIREDYLRVLRFFRFQAWYGRTAPDEAALRACAAHRDGLAGLSVERISAEWLKLLAAPDPGLALELMEKTGVLAVIGGDQLRLSPRIIAFSNDPLVRWLAMLQGDADQVDAMARRFRLSRAQTKRMVEARRAQAVVNIDTSEREARRSLYQHGVQPFLDALALAEAAAGRRAEALRDLASQWRRPVLPVDGARLKALGVQPGPAMGEQLARLEARWLESDFDDDAIDSELDLIREKISKTE
ncbi:MAG: CCA tRNA nucleotidyltransferase [Brevundimonas sp.]|jgi:poly(A) polymerase|uniref:CCA tRNA nucleotidyltransferase n=1 Tax=Brevundimonas sp. TaxID=1871086 RepID=UPI00391DDF00